MEAINPDSARTAISRIRELIAAAPPPRRIEVAIQHLRDEKENLPAYSREWLEQTKDLPSGAVVVIEDGEFSLLTDPDGNLLSFR